MVVVHCSHSESHPGLASATTVPGVWPQGFTGMDQQDPAGMFTREEGLSCVTRTTLVEPEPSTAYLGIPRNWSPSETTKRWASLVSRLSQVSKLLQVSITSDVCDTTDSTLGHLLR